MIKRILATLVATTTLVTIIVIGGSEAARAADAPEPMPIEMGRRYVPVAAQPDNGWTLRPETRVMSATELAQWDLPVIEVTRVAVDPVLRVVQTYEGDATLNDAEIASLTSLNELRASLGLSTLRASADLSDFAHSWAIIMSETDFEHSSFDDSVKLLTGDRTSFGENIVWHSSADLTAEEAAAEFHQLWVDSPGHYANMVNPAWTEAGLGLFRNDGGWWGVHNFSNGTND